MGHPLAVHLGPEDRILKHQVFRDQARLENLPSPVDVLDVQVDGFDALLEPQAQQVPFGGRENARQDIEGYEAFLRIGLAVDRERDSDAAEQQLGFAAAIVENVGRYLAEPAG
jgi:hypothetical protein